MVYLSFYLWTQSPLVDSRASTNLVDSRSSPLLNSRSLSLILLIQDLWNFKNRKFKFNSGLLPQHHCVNLLSNSVFCSCLRVPCIIVQITFSWNLHLKINRYNLIDTQLTSFKGRYWKRNFSPNTNGSCVSLWEIYVHHLTLPYVSFKEALRFKRIVSFVNRSLTTVHRIGHRCPLPLSFPLPGSSLISWTHALLVDPFFSITSTTVVRCLDRRNGERTWTVTPIRFQGKDSGGFVLGVTISFPFSASGPDDAEKQVFCENSTEIATYKGT